MWEEEDEDLTSDKQWQMHKYRDERHNENKRNRRIYLNVIVFCGDCETKMRFNVRKSTNVSYGLIQAFLQKESWLRKGSNNQWRHSFWPWNGGSKS